MKRVLGVKFTLDSKFVLSSSSDQNVRLWKAHASEIIGPVIIIIIILKHF